MLLGPFSGGLNNAVDPSSVADNELVSIENWDIDVDGSLKSRPPYVNFVASPVNSLTQTQSPDTLGIFYAVDGTPWIICSNGVNGTYAYRADVADPSSNAAYHKTVSSTVSYVAMAQFNGSAYLVAPGGSCGSWTPSGGFVADANMPAGNTIAVHAYRLFVAAGYNDGAQPTRVWYSNILSDIGLGLWTAANNYVDVGAGDGQAVTALVDYGTELLVFRTGSIWSLSYTTDISAGIVQPTILGTGLEDGRCIAVAEDYIYFLYRGRAYEFFNNTVQQINQLVQFTGTSIAASEPFWVSVFNNRVIFGAHDYQYVFNRILRVWTSWVRSDGHTVGRLIELHASTTQLPKAFGFLTDSASFFSSGSTPSAHLLVMTDGYLSGVAETMVCKVTTKMYGYGAEAQYKRLFWWGVDASFYGELDVWVQPLVLNASVTWGQLITRGITWGALLKYTWGDPVPPIVATDSADGISGGYVRRRFAKFLKSLRFRQIQYHMEFHSDGTPSTAPTRLFALTTFVSLKEHVFDKVS